MFAECLPDFRSQKMRSKIRIGIIGCGQIAQQHLQNYAAIPDAEVVAIADSDAETLAATAAKFGIGETYSTLQELLDGASLDAVDVCLHNNYHADAAIRVMEAGLHCYSEKPMAGSYADALAMLDASHRTGNMLHIQLALIYSDETKAAKSLIDGGAIGDAYYARATGHRRRGRPYVDGYGKPSFVQHDIAAGGALFDMGVYHISEMLHLLGNPGVLRVSGRTFQKVELDELRAQAGRYSVEELGCGFVNFANGALLEIAEAWAIHLDSFEGSFIVGDKGGIRPDRVVPEDDKDLDAQRKIMREQPGNRKAAIPISKQVQAAVTVLKEKLAGSPWPASEKDDLAKQDSGSKRETGE
jgi:predicted dehydrogenase